MTKKIKIVPLEKGSENFINILPASEFIPEWYRLSKSKAPDTFSELNIHTNGMTNSTYKKCTPFLDALTVGYVMYLTADIEVIRKPDGMPYIIWRTARTIITEHSDWQWNGVPVPNGYSPFVYKWNNGLALNTPTGYSLLFTSPFNRFDLPFTTITGIVDCDSYKLPVQFPFFIKNDFIGIIEKGTPVAQIIPIKRDSWKTQVEPYKEDLYYNLKEQYLSTIKRSYKNNHWFKKDYK